MNSAGLLEQLNVSRETIERFEVFEAILRKWNPRINLVSRDSLEKIWTRHIVDSVQVFRSGPKAETWLDLGSGGGFPGIIVAILADAGTKVTLIESDQRKSAFLRTAAREVGVDCQVIAKRVESVEKQQADVVSARALASLADLLAYSDRHMAFGATGLFPKGVTWQKEVDAARQQWNFEVEPIRSLTEPGAAILKIKGLSRV